MSKTHPVAQETPAPQESPLYIRISPVIEAEYRRRNVFPDLRLDRAIRVINAGTGIYRISRALAREILADIKARQAEDTLSRGQRTAYTSLNRNLIQELKGSLPAPREDSGPEAAQADQESAYARFQLGEMVQFRGCPARVMTGYQWWKVEGPQGDHVNPETGPVRYRPGYIIHSEGWGGFRFAAPYELAREDGKPAHLRLIPN